MCLWIADVDPGSFQCPSALVCGTTFKGDGDGLVEVLRKGICLGLELRDLRPCLWVEHCDGALYTSSTEGVDDLEAAIGYADLDFVAGLAGFDRALERVEGDGYVDCFAGYGLFQPVRGKHVLVGDSEANAAAGITDDPYTQQRWPG
jgi:hypothetical protein